MEFVKVTEVIEDLDVIGEVGTVTYDGVMLNETIAAFGYQFSAGTYFAVERVGRVDGELRPLGTLDSSLLSLNLPGKLSIRDIANMSALEFLAVMVDAKEFTL
ncbi:hypothetical protein D3C78_1549180 [compost metagenome]